MSGAAERVLGRAEAILRVVESSIEEIRKSREENERLTARLEMVLPDVESLREIVPEIEDTLARSRPSEFLTVPDLAKLMKVNQRTVRQLYYDRVIPGYQEVEKGWLRFDWSEVRTALKEHSYHETARAVG
jgi:hypothetical protein